MDHWDCIMESLKLDSNPHQFEWFWSNHLTHSRLDFTYTFECAGGCNAVQSFSMKCSSNYDLLLHVRYNGDSILCCFVHSNVEHIGVLDWISIPGRKLDMPLACSTTPHVYLMTHNKDRIILFHKQISLVDRSWYCIPRLSFNVGMLQLILIDC